MRAVGLSSVAILRLMADEFPELAVACADDALTVPQSVIEIARSVDKELAVDAVQPRSWRVGNSTNFIASRGGVDSDSTRAMRCTALVWYWSHETTCMPGPISTPPWLRTCGRIQLGLRRAGEGRDRCWSNSTVNDSVR